jgi:hypothetical protein
MLWMCECPTACRRAVEIPLELALRLQRDVLFLIVDGCQGGPASDDRLAETHAGFRLYRPSPETAQMAADLIREAEKYIGTLSETEKAIAFQVAEEALYREK